MGSFSGASASGYFALPITSAKRSPAAGDGVVQTTEKRAIRREARLVFILRRSKKKGADPARAPTTLLHAKSIIKPASQTVNRLQNLFYRDNSTAAISPRSIRSRVANVACRTHHSARARFP